MRARAAPALGLFVAVAVGVSGVAAPAQAARGKPVVDTTAPTVSHEPPGSCSDVNDCTVSASIVDDTGVFDPTLLFRLKGSAAYDRVPMKKKDGAKDVYTGVIPAAVAAAGDVEYLIEAFDIEGNGPSRAGTEGAPLVLKKAVAVVVTPPPPPPPPPPPVVEEDNTGLVVGVVAASAAVVVLAGVGIGFAVYALRPPAPDVVTVNVSGPSPFAALVLP